MTPTEHRRHRPGKLVLRTLAGLALVIVVLAVCESRGWSFLRAPMENMLGQRLQRRVDLGEQFALHLWGAIRLNTNALSVGVFPAGPHLLEASNARLEIPYATLFNLLRSGSSTPLHITSLEVDRLDLTLTRDAQGRANWRFTPQPETPSTSAPMTLPRFGTLWVKAGHVQVSDDMLKLQLDANVSTTEGEQANGAKGLLIHGSGQYLHKPFEVHITSGGVLALADASAAPIAVPISVKASAGRARLTFTGQARDPLALSDLDGTLTLSGPSLAAVGDAVGVTLPTTTLFSLKGQLGKVGQVWSLKQTDLRVGSSRLGGTFTFDRRPSVPFLSGELTGTRFVLSDLAPAFGAQAPGADNPPPPQGKVLPQRSFDIPSLHAMNAQVKVRLQSAELGSLFAQAFEPLDGELTLKSGVLTVTDMLARTAQGQVSGKLSLDANPQPPLWTADVHWKGIRLEQWLSPRNEFARKDQADKGTNHRYVTGQLGGHALLHGQGNSAAQMLASTDGDAQAWVQDGKVSHLMVEAIGLDVAQALGVIVVGDNLLPMRCAVVRMKAQHGELRPEVAIIDTTDSTLLVSGSMSLVDERLDLLMTAKPKDLSPLTLRSPLKVEGTFAHPQVSLQAKPLGIKVLSAVALGFVNPLASLIPFIDLGEPGDGGCQQALERLKGDHPKPLPIR